MTKIDYRGCFGRFCFFCNTLLQALMEKLFYCLSSATIQSTGKRAEVFWDVQRLEDGSDFQDDFMNAMQRFIVGCWLSPRHCFVAGWPAPRSSASLHACACFYFICLPAILFPAFLWMGWHCCGFACFRSGGVVLLLSHAALERFKGIKSGAERCDNVLLEWTLALVLSKLGLLSFVLPVMCGDYKETEEGTLELEGFSSKVVDQLPDVALKAVHEKVTKYLVDSQGLPSSKAENMLQELTVKVCVVSVRVLRVVALSSLMILDICAWLVAFAWVKGVVKSLTTIMAFRCKSKLKEVRAAGEGDSSSLQGLHKACAEMISPLMNKHAAKQAADNKSACSPFIV